MDSSVDVADCPYSRNAALKTKAGKWLTLYEKNKLAKSDLYANQIAEDTKKSLFVETWLNGPREDWKNQCGDLFVKNIRAINHKKHDVAWKSEEDHSKWAVSDKGNLVCIGDINRQVYLTVSLFCYNQVNVQKSQANRGGGSLCIQDTEIWQFFRDSIDVVECCPGEKSCEAQPEDSVDVPSSARKPGDPKQPFKPNQANTKPNGKQQPAKTPPKTQQLAKTPPKTQQKPKIVPKNQNPRSTSPKKQRGQWLIMLLSTNKLCTVILVLYFLYNPTNLQDNNIQTNKLVSI